jgi:hypothetical protein
LRTSWSAASRWLPDSSPDGPASTRTSEVNVAGFATCCCDQLRPYDRNKRKHGFIGSSDAGSARLSTSSKACTYRAARTRVTGSCAAEAMGVGVWRRTPTGVTPRSRRRDFQTLIKAGSRRRPGDVNRSATRRREG